MLLFGSLALEINVLSNLQASVHIRHLLPVRLSAKSDNTAAGEQSGQRSQSRSPSPFNGAKAGDERTNGRSAAFPSAGVRRESF